MERKLKHLLYGSCFLLVSGWLGACQDTNTPLPNDTAVRTGVLPNGLTYYIRKNAEPRQQAYLMLVNKIGSLVENDDQRGLAHFTEHMAFKGTKNFPKNSLVNTLQKMGVRFGADLNAYTSYDQTVYKLDIPLNDSASLPRGLQILRDWAGNVEMDSAAIDAERGVILEEKRQRKGAGERISEKTTPILLNNARHVERLPIGTDQVLTTFNHDVLRKFYRDWYRPDLQAIVVVGDFDPEKIEEKIKQQFGDLVKPADAPPLPDFPVTLNGRKTFHVVHDEEVKTVSLQLYCKLKITPLRTEEHLKSGVDNQLFNDMLSKRVQQLYRQSAPPFLQASAGIGPITEGLAGPSVQISFLPGGIEKGYTAVLTELERIRKYGFTEDELRLAKTALGEAQNYRYNQREKKSSVAFAEEYVQAFLQNIPFPGDEYTNKLIRERLKQVQLSDVNPLIKNFFDSKDQDLILVAPAGTKERLPTETDLKTWTANVAKATIENYKEAVTANDLPKLATRPGTISETKALADIGAFEWTLSNGARVILKPTRFNDDKILINGFSPGGLSLYGPSDYDAATFAVSVASSGGVAGLKVQELSNVLTGKMVQFQPFIGEYAEGFSGASSKKDLETCLKLIHLYFTQSQLDVTAVANMLSNSKLGLEKRYQMPGNLLMDSVNAFMSGNHWRTRPMTIERLDAIVPSRSLEIFKERFADASGFTFLVTGDFTPEAIKPLVEQYLANLPALHKKEEAVDMGIHIADKNRTIIVKGELENKATVQLVIPGTYGGTPWENVQLNCLQAILQYRITETLRNKESAAYSPSVNVQKTHFPVPRYSFSISFNCDPTRAKMLSADVKSVVNQLAEQGPPQEDLTKLLAENRAGMAKMSVTSEFWHNTLLNSLQNGYDLGEVNRMERYLGLITADRIKEAANKFLKKKPFMDFYMMPK